MINKKKHSRNRRSHGSSNDDMHDGIPNWCYTAAKKSIVTPAGIYSMHLRRQKEEKELRRTRQWRD